jgi:hypothetical protein
MSFRTLQDRLLDYLGEQYSGNVSLDHYKFLLNTSMQDLAEETDWNFLRRRGSLRLVAPYSTGVIGATEGGSSIVPGGGTFGYTYIGAEIRIEDGTDETYEVTGYDGTNLEIAPSYNSDTVALYATGTVTVTNGSATVTGSGTTFTSAMVGRYFHVAGDTDRYLISAFVSATEITLSTVYGGTGGAGQSYNIGLAYTMSKSQYRIPLNVGHIASAFIRSTGNPLFGAHPYVQDYIDPDDQASGEPTEMRIVGHTSKALYSVSTCTVTEGSATVNFNASVTLDNYFVGKDFRVAGDLRHYTIESVNIGGDSLVLTEAYLGDDGTDVSYEIEPAGTPEVRFEQFPVGAEYTVDYRYLIRHPWLISDNEMPLFPPSLYPLVYHKAHLEILIQENESGEKIGLAERRVKSLMERAESQHRTLHNKFMVGTSQFPQVGHRRIHPGMLSGNWGW